MRCCRRRRYATKSRKVGLKSFARSEAFSVRPIPDLPSESAVTWRELLTKNFQKSRLRAPGCQNEGGILAAAPGMMLLVVLPGRPLNEVEHATCILDRKELRGIVAGKDLTKADGDKDGTLDKTEYEAVAAAHPYTGKRLHLEMLGEPA